MKNRDRTFNVSRRLILKKGVIAVAGVAGAGALLRSSVVTAAAEATTSGKASKSGMMYQDKPHGDQDCSNCIHFIPGATKSADGACTVVDGSISPQAWCIAYAPKN